MTDSQQPLDQPTPAAAGEPAPQQPATLGMPHQASSPPAATPLSDPADSTDTQTWEIPAPATPVPQSIAPPPAAATPPPPPAAAPPPPQSWQQPAQQWQQPGQQWQQQVPPVVPPPPAAAPPPPQQWQQPAQQWQPPAQPVQPGPPWQQSPQYPQPPYPAQSYVQQAPYAAPYDQQWPAQQPYGSSTMVNLAGLLMVALGIVIAVLGVYSTMLGNDIGRFIHSNSIKVFDLRIDPATLAAVLTWLPAALIILGVLQVLAGGGVFGHKGWGRWLGMLLALIGLLASIFSVSLALALAGGASVSVLIAVVLLLGYAYILLALIAGGGHFRRRTAPR